LLGQGKGFGSNRPIPTNYLLRRARPVKLWGVRCVVRRPKYRLTCSLLLLDEFSAIAQRRGRSPLGEFSINAPPRRERVDVQRQFCCAISHIAFKPVWMDRRYAIWGGGLDPQGSANVKRSLGQGHMSKYVRPGA